MHIRLEIWFSHWRYSSPDGDTAVPAGHTALLDGYVAWNGYALRYLLEWQKFDMLYNILERMYFV
jgi:hypothetical protein